MVMIIIMCEKKKINNISMTMRKIKEEIFFTKHKNISMTNQIIDNLNKILTIVIQRFTTKIK